MTDAPITVVDYGCGNLASLTNGLAARGFGVRRAACPEELVGARCVVLPGVGHFGHAAEVLRQTRLDRALVAHAARGGRLVGICLGMQLLFEASDEAPGVPGLGLLPGRFRRFEGNGIKIPHMGWSAVDFGTGRAPLAAYFVHTFYLPDWTRPRLPELVGTADHGTRFIAAFVAGNIGGAQFHPEKSGQAGLDFLAEVLRWS